jgi:hypothetical protein
MANKVNNRYFGQTGVDATPKLPIRVYNGSAKEGYIVNQVGARRFKCADDTTTYTDGTNALTVGSQYVIVSVGDSNFAEIGARANAAGIVFTATATATTGGTTGTVYEVITAKLVAGTDSDPTTANTATLVGLTGVGSANVRPVTLKKINFRTAVDFSGNRYKWSLQDDSSQTLLVLTAI